MVGTSSAAKFEKVPSSRNYRMQQKSPHSNAVPCKVLGKGLITKNALARACIILYVILYIIPSYSYCPRRYWEMIMRNEEDTLRKEVIKYRCIDAGYYVSGTIKDSGMLFA